MSWWSHTYSAGSSPGGPFGEARTLLCTATNAQNVRNDENESLKGPKTVSATFQIQFLGLRLLVQCLRNVWNFWPRPPFLGPRPVWVLLFAGAETGRPWPRWKSCWLWWPFCSLGCRAVCWMGILTIKHRGWTDKAGGVTLKGNWFVRGEYLKMAISSGNWW